MAEDRSSDLRRAVLDLGSVCHLRTLVLGVDNDRIRPTPSSRAIGYAPIRYSRAIGYAPIRYTIWV